MVDPWLALSLRSPAFDLPVLRFFQPGADLITPEVTRRRCRGSTAVFSEIAGLSNLTVKGTKGLTPKDGGEETLTSGLVAISRKGADPFEQVGDANGLLTLDGL